MARTVNVNDIARVSYEVSRQIRADCGEKLLPEWRELDGDIRRMYVSSTEDILHSDCTTPEDWHNAWCKLHLLKGWTYGEYVDTQKKTHPRLLPYSELSVAVRLRESAVYAVVKSMREFVEVAACAGPVS